VLRDQTTVLPGAPPHLRLIVSSDEVLAEAESLSLLSRSVLQRNHAAVEKLKPVLEQVDALEAAVMELEGLAAAAHTQSKGLESAFAELLG
jgi:hypothetical protein